MISPYPYPYPMKATETMRLHRGKDLV